jgi:hypothetical protein
MSEPFMVASGHHRYQEIWHQNRPTRKSAAQVIIVPADFRHRGVQRRDEDMLGLLQKKRIVNYKGFVEIR